jgi:hypothetical protein
MVWSDRSLFRGPPRKEHQQAMDLMRRKVQAQYAAIKLRRKQNGDFHL